MKIYILRGTTGEYSDRSDWIVRAYLSEEKAKSVQQDLTDLFAIWWKANNEDYYSEEGFESAAWKAITNIDPMCMVDYTGTSWWVRECDLI